MHVQLYILGVFTSQDTIHFFLSDILYLKFILNVSIILESNASLPLDCPLILIGYIIFEGHPAEQMTSIFFFGDGSSHLLSHLNV